MAQGPARSGEGQRRVSPGWVSKRGPLGLRSGPRDPWQGLLTRCGVSGCGYYQQVLSFPSASFHLGRLRGAQTDRQTVERTDRPAGQLQTRRDGPAFPLPNRTLPAQPRLFTIRSTGLHTHTHTHTHTKTHTPWRVVTGEPKNKETSAVPHWPHNPSRCPPHGGGTY